MKRQKVPPDVLFLDTSGDVPIYVTRNGCRCTKTIEELIDEERKNLGTILDNVIDNLGE